MKGFRPTYTYISVKTYTRQALYERGRSKVDKPTTSNPNHLQNVE